MSYLYVSKSNETLITIEGLPEFDSTEYRVLCDGGQVGPLYSSTRDAMTGTLALIPTACPVRDNPACALDYFQSEDWAYALGNEYGRNQLAAGCDLEEYPLSGEWTGGMSPRDVFAEVVGRAPDMDTEYDDVSQFADNWDDGYRAA